MRRFKIQIACAVVGFTIVAACSDDDSATDAAGTTASPGPGQGGASSSAASVGGGGAGGEGASGSRIGAACTSDADCGSGHCIESTEAVPFLGGGGPAGGYCSKDCETDDDCEGVGVCVDYEDRWECYLECQTGPQGMAIDDPLDPSKCHGREDVRCTQYPSAAVCVPSCGSDSQCDGGLVCDPRSTSCVAEPTTGLPMGAACDPDAEEDACAGYCLESTFGVFCASLCVLGGVADALDCGGLEQGACAIPLVGYGAGDAGFCSPACSAQSDCQNPDFWCFGIPELTGVYVANGFCRAAETCARGQADCSIGTCSDTPYGPFCLDPAFP